MQFNILYVDPPWAYKVYSKKGQGRSAENHYRTMNIEDIYGLDIQSIAADDCILVSMGDIPLSGTGAGNDPKVGIYL